MTLVTSHDRGCTLRLGGHQLAAGWGGGIPAPGTQAVPACSRRPASALAKARAQCRQVQAPPNPRNHSTFRLYPSKPLYKAAIRSRYTSRRALAGNRWSPSTSQRYFTSGYAHGSRIGSQAPSASTTSAATFSMERSFIWRQTPDVKKATTRTARQVQAASATRAVLPGVFSWTDRVLKPRGQSTKTPHLLERPGHSNELDDLLPFHLHHEAALIGFGAELRLHINRDRRLRLRRLDQRLSQQNRHSDVACWGGTVRLCWSCDSAGYLELRVSFCKGLASLRRNDAHICLRVLGLCFLR